MRNELNNNDLKNFKNLLIWQRGIQITKEVYKKIKNMPQNTKYELGFQMFRSAISIPSNIAEGSSRSSAKDYRRFLEIALGSAFELETQVIISDEITDGKDESITNLLSQIDEEQKMMMSFIKKVTQSY